jgi:hypothetical protein
VRQRSGENQFDDLAKRAVAPTGRPAAPRRRDPFGARVVHASPAAGPDNKPFLHLFGRAGG